MTTVQSVDRPEGLGQALVHAQFALALLDEAKAPAHVGANLDLVICQLRDILGRHDQLTVDDADLGA